MDINIPVENPELMMKMHNYMSSQSEDDEKTLFEAILKANFLGPVSLENWKDCFSGKQVLDQDVKLELLSIKDDKNNIYLPTFTDWNEINKWRNDDKLKTIILTFEDYAKVFRNNCEMVGLAINPYGENLIIHKEQIECIVNSRKLRGGEIVKIGVPEKYPFEMSKEYEEFFTTQRCVKEAYLLLMVRENNQQNYLMVIDTDEDVDIIHPKLAKIATKHLKKNEVIDFITKNKKFGNLVIQGQSPFYRLI